jgi:hypothetical protein
MIRKIILSAGFALMTILASAQHFDLRAYGGFNVLQLTSDQGNNIIDEILHHRSVTGRPGYQFGAAVTFGDRFYVQPGIQISTGTTKVVNENSITGTEFTDESTLSMISVPLKVGVRLIDPNDENIFNVRVFGGFDGSHVTKVTHGTKSGVEGDLNEDDYSNLIMAADFGLGIDIAFLFIDMGYQLGLSPVHSGGDNAKGNTFYGNLGIRIGL